MTQTRPGKGDWTKRFGASRRAKDKAYCEAAERAIEAEIAKKADPPSAVNSEAWRGQLDALQNERRRELERLTGKNLRTI